MFIYKDNFKLVSPRCIVFKCDYLSITKIKGIENLKENTIRKFSLPIGILFSCFEYES